MPHSQKNNDPQKDLLKQGLSGRAMPHPMKGSYPQEAWFTGTVDMLDDTPMVPEKMSPHTVGYAGYQGALQALPLGYQRTRYKKQVYLTPARSLDNWLQRHVGDVLLGVRDVMLGHVLVVGGLGLLCVILLSYVPQTDWLSSINQVQKQGFGVYQWLFIGCFMIPIVTRHRHYAYAVGVLGMGVLLSGLCMWMTGLYLR
jgi:hypothetical protein